MTPPTAGIGRAHDPVPPGHGARARRAHVRRLPLRPLGRPPRRPPRRDAQRGGREVRAEVRDAAAGIDDAHAVVATAWPTAYAVLASPAKGHRVYLVQDLEPSFYPAGGEALLAEATYRFGFHGITAGRWLVRRAGRPLRHGRRPLRLRLRPRPLRAPRGPAGAGRRTGVCFFARPITPRRGLRPRRARPRGVRGPPTRRRHPPVRRPGRAGCAFPATDHGVLTPVRAEPASTSAAPPASCCRPRTCRSCPTRCWPPAASRSSTTPTTTAIVARQPPRGLRARDPPRHRRCARAASSIAAGRPMAAADAAAAHASVRGRSWDEAGHRGRADHPRASWTETAWRLSPSLIVGAGGFGRETLEVVRAVNAAHRAVTGDDRWDLVGVLDDDEARWGIAVAAHPHRRARSTRPPTTRPPGSSCAPAAPATTRPRPAIVERLAARGVERPGVRHAGPPRGRPAAVVPPRRGHGRARRRRGHRRRGDRRPRRPHAARRADPRRRARRLRHRRRRRPARRRRDRRARRLPGRRLPPSARACSIGPWALVGMGAAVARRRPAPPRSGPASPPVSSEPSISPERFIPHDIRDQPHHRTGRAGAARRPRSRLPSRSSTCRCSTPRWRREVERGLGPRGRRGLVRRSAPTSRRSRRSSPGSPAPPTASASPTAPTPSSSRCGPRGIGPGDEVIVPANTFIATAEAVSARRRRPGARRLRRRPPAHRPGRRAPSASAARTRAVDGGPPLRPDGARRGALADAVPDRRRPDRGRRPVAGRHRATAGRAAASAPRRGTSFYPGKNLGAYGDAGAVLTSRRRHRRPTVRALRAHGGTRKYHHDLVGMNSRLDTLQAVVLRAKLRRLDAVERAAPGRRPPLRRAARGRRRRAASRRRCRATSTCGTSTWCGSPSATAVLARLERGRHRRRHPLPDAGPPARRLRRPRPRPGRLPGGRGGGRARSCRCRCSPASPPAQQERVASRSLDRRGAREVTGRDGRRVRPPAGPVRERRGRRRAPASGRAPTCCPARSSAPTATSATTPSSRAGCASATGSRSRTPCCSSTASPSRTTCSSGPNVVFTNDLTPRAHVRKGPGSSSWPPPCERGATIGANATIVCGPHRRPARLRRRPARS